MLLITPSETEFSTIFVQLQCHNKYLWSEHNITATETNSDNQSGRWVTNLVDEEYVDAFTHLPTYLPPLENTLMEQS